MSERRPFDLLNELLDNSILIKLKEGEEITGVLYAFDAHMNLVIEDAKQGDKSIGKLLVRGDSIIFISNREK
jgi:small nuclear ribonucleoprotein (snRNP)-like protein